MPQDRQVRFLDRTTPPHIFTLVMLAASGAMNMSVFLPALPQMTAYFATDYEVMQLSVSAYLAVTAVVQLVIGSMSDHFGRRPTMLLCLCVFLAATVGCLLAPTAEVFLIFRMLQATVAVGLVLSRAVVRDMVPQEEAASMIGYVTMGMSLVPMVAPMVGGALNQAFGWHAIFVMLICTGSAVLALAWADMGETARGMSKTLREQAAEYPELLASRRFWGYAFAAAFASGSFFAFLGGAPFVASEVFGLSSFWTGAGFGAPAIGYAFGNFLSGRFSVRVGINRMILWGALINAGGMGCGLALALFGFDAPLVFFGFCTFVGIGNGMVVPNGSAGMLSVRPHLAGSASGLGTAILIGGGAGMSAFAGVLLKMGNGSAPLQALMFTTGTLAIAAILIVIRRERQLAAT